MNVLVKYRPYFCQKFNRLCSEAVLYCGGSECEKSPFLCEFKEELFDAEHQKILFKENVQEFEFCANPLGEDGRIVNIDNDFGLYRGISIVDYVSVDDKVVWSLEGV